MPLQTKIEFSRRKDSLSVKQSSITLGLSQQYRLLPMRLSHYDEGSAIAQKVSALANRTETQARDVFDIYHLLYIKKPEKITKNEDKQRAEEALLSISFGDYKSQVVAFLEPEYQMEYEKEKVWHDMCNQVLAYLEE